MPPVLLKLRRVSVLSIKMDELIIKINNDGKQIFAFQGERLSDVLIRNGYYIPMPCGGKGRCGKCCVDLNGFSVLACRTFLTKDIEVSLPINGTNIYVHQGLIESEMFQGDVASFALDIGTTTVTLALLDGEDGVSETVTFKNPQTIYGADVITRINAVKTVGTEALRKLLIDEISKIIGELGKKYGFQKVNEITVCGNTTMLHIFWGEDCTTLGYAPYTPRFIGKRNGSALEFGFPFESKVRSLAGISAFVGSDVAAGLVTAEMPQEGRKNIWIDFGTNAEVAVFDSKEYITTATAAGPCFEGANISCGMPATDGAITRFILGGDNIPEITHLGKEPIGLCGTGLIDVVAELLKKGIIDSTGYLKIDKGFPICHNVVLTQKDIREFQLAKSAIRSGLETLLEKAGAKYEDVEKVYLAGGFSSFISVDSATICGLIPKVFSDRCVSLANAALRGTVMCAQGKADEQRVVELAMPIELNAQECFTDKFMEYIGF